MHTPTETWTPTGLCSAQEKMYSFQSGCWGGPCRPAGRGALTDASSGPVQGSGEALPPAGQGPGLTLAGEGHPGRRAAGAKAGVEPAGPRRGQRGCLQHQSEPGREGEAARGTGLGVPTGGEQGRERPGGLHARTGPAQLFNVLSRLVIPFLPRSKCLLISWLQSPSAVVNI